jgi:hypothetical protein
MSSPIRPPLWITEADGNPSGRPINKIVVSNGTLTINGTTATITTGGSGGGGTVTNVSSSDSFISITNPNTTPSITIQDATTSQDGILTSTDWNTFNNKTSNSGTVTSVGSSQAFVSVASATTTPSITIGNASGSATGVLTSTDWTTFNNKGSGDGTVTSVGSSQAFVTVASATTTPSITIGSASGSATGVLTSTDWTTFNNKQDSLTLTTTGSSGAATLTGSTLNIPQYGGGGVTFPLEGSNGSAAAPTYSFSGNTNTGIYKASTDELNISLGGTRVFDFQKSGTSGKLQFRGSTPIIECDDAGADLSLRSGGSTYAEILIQNENSNIDIKPAGTGKVKISNAYTLPSAVTTTNDYVLTAQTDGTTAWAAAGGGGGGISWSTPVDSTLTPDTTATYDMGTSTVLFRSAYFSSTVNTGSINMTGDLTRPNGSLQITAGGSQGSRAHIFLPNNETNMKINGSSSSKTDIILDTRWNDASNTATIQLKTKGQTRFQVGADGELKVGSNAGDSGQVLTSAGANAAPTWSDAAGGSGTVTVGTNAGNNNLAYFSGATEISNTNNISINAVAGSADFFGQIESSKFVVASGGAGISFADGTTQTTAASGGSSIWNQTNTKNNINSSYRRFVVSRLAPYGQYGTGTTTTGVVNSPHCRPFISPVSGDVTEIGINVTTADATATTKLMIGIYSDSNGAPDSLLTTAVMNTTSTGSSFQTSFTGTATLVAGTQYWYMWVRNNTTNSINFSAASNTHLVWVGASSTVSAGMNQQSVLSLSGSDNSLPSTTTQSNLTPSFYGCLELGLKIA